MDNLVIVECRKYKDQVLNWLNAFYGDRIYYYSVLDNGDSLSIRVRLTLSYNLYIKRANGITSYISRTFRYPQYIKVNYRYIKNFFDLTIICGEANNEVH